MESSEITSSSEEEEDFLHFLSLLKNEIEERKKDKEIFKLGILMHRTPDPDCFGAALGMKKLVNFWFPSVECVLIYKGDISHPQNKTMVNVLNMNLFNLDESDSPLMEIVDSCIVVDVTPERCGLTYKSDYSDGFFIFTCDHHKPDTKISKYKDIRMVGATTSMVWEYLHKEGCNFDSNIDDDGTVATAMLVGIKTDTNDLVSDNITDLDFEAYKNLISYVNHRQLSSIINYPIPPYHFELRKRLEVDGNTVVENGCFIGGIGYLGASKRDSLPTIAEERARVEGIDTAFVFAIVGENIEVSVRSSGISIDINNLCQNIFGKEYAGGKTGSGGARIPMNFLSVADSDDKIRDKMWESVRDFIIEKISIEMAEHR
jgi:nanoRNase/pAp phosphatase (c-di-AMP/oligoRNAs hydrolase)